MVEVWGSAFNDRILAYRRQQDLPLTPRPPAVLIQRIVNADRSEVAFGADPLTGRWSVAIVAAVNGLGTALVSSESTAHTDPVDRAEHVLGPSGRDGREPPSLLNGLPRKPPTSIGNSTLTHPARAPFPVGQPPSESNISAFRCFPFPSAVLPALGLLWQETKWMDRSRESPPAPFVGELSP